jgi:hypothetical protein
MANSIIDGTTFDLSRINYLNVKTSKMGGKTIGMIDRETKKSIFISTPLLYSWGMQKVVIKDKNGEIQPQTGPDKYSFAIQCPANEAENPEGFAFFEKIKEFEQKILQDAFAHSTEWFGKQHKSIDATEALLNRMLYYPKGDSTRAPTFKVTVPVWENACKSEIYDMDGVKLFPMPGVNDPESMLAHIPRGDILTILQCGGLYIINGKFGVTWKLTQAVVSKPKETVVAGICHINIKRQDREKLATALTPNQDESEDVGSCHVDFADDDLAPSEVAAATVAAPAPTPVAAPVAAVTEEVAAAETSTTKRKVIKKKPTA